MHKPIILRGGMAEVVNVYGPKASGKTLNAERLREHFRCKSIVDDGAEHRQAFEFAGHGPHLLLTEHPVRAPGVRNVPISVALQAMGGRRV